MKHAVSRELFSYWDRLRKGRAAPERSDIDPAAIRGALADTFILAAERDPARPPLTVRLAGTRLNALFLTELKGRGLLELWEDSDRDAVSRIIDTVLNDAAPLVAGVRGGPPDHRPIDLEMILLPLRHHGRTHARIIGAISPIEMPSWLGLMPLQHLSLTSLRLIDPASPETTQFYLRPRSSPASDASESQDEPTRRYGRFVVHQGGR